MESILASPKQTYHVFSLHLHPMQPLGSQLCLLWVLDSNELQIVVKWWLDLDTSRGSSCALCPGVALDPLGHHAATYRCGGDVVIHQNRLCDVFLSFCHQAHIAARLEAGSGLTPGLDHTRPADVLVRDWAQGKPAAFDITVISPLTPAILADASVRVGAAAEAAERIKHTANDPKCAELGWVCVPLAVETYCNWGEEARSILATHLAFGSAFFKARVISIYVWEAKYHPGENHSKGHTGQECGPY